MKSFEEQVVLPLASQTKGTWFHPESVFVKIHMFSMCLCGFPQVSLVSSQNMPEGG